MAEAKKKAAPKAKASEDTPHRPASLDRDSAAIQANKALAILAKYNPGLARQVAQELEG